MKIAIPVDTSNMERSVCISFGRSPYFLVYDTENKESVFLENTAAQSPGGAGIKAAQIIVDSNADVLLTPRCGENAALVINEAKIKIYKTSGTSITENLEDFNQGKLSLLEEIHAGFHGHGGN